MNEIHGLVLRFATMPCLGCTEGNMCATCEARKLLPAAGTIEDLVEAAYGVREMEPKVADYAGLTDALDNYSAAMGR